jgi:hypothetical protein
MTRFTPGGCSGVRLRLHRPTWQRLGVELSITRHKGVVRNEMIELSTVNCGK